MARSWGWAFFLNSDSHFSERSPGETNKKHLIGYSLSLCFELSGDA